MVKDEKTISHNGLLGRVVKIPDTAITVIVPDGLVMCKDNKGKYDICSHDGCKNAVVIIANERGEYVEATGRARIPCNGAIGKGLPVASDGTGACKFSPWGSLKPGFEIGFILQVHSNGEVDLFTRGHGSYA